MTAQLKSTIYALTVTCIFLFILISSMNLYAQDVTTAADVQEGTLAVTPCDVRELPANVWTEIRFDNRGNPCSSHASQLQGTCSANAWNWNLDGNIAFQTAPGYHKVRVRVEVWTGGGGGACYPTLPEITCDNPYYKLKKQDNTVELDIQNTDLMLPFNTVGGYLLNSDYAYAGDGNYQGLWIFAMPLGRPAICKSISFHDVGAN